MYKKIFYTEYLIYALLCYIYIISKLVYIIFIDSIYNKISYFLGKWLWTILFKYK